MTRREPCLAPYGMHNDWALVGRIFSRPAGRMTWQTVESVSPLVEAISREGTFLEETKTANRRRGRDHKNGCCAFHHTYIGSGVSCIVPSSPSPSRYLSELFSAKEQCCGYWQRTGPRLHSLLLRYYEFVIKLVHS